MTDTSNLIARLQGLDGPDDWCEFHLWRIANPEHPRWFMGDIGSLEGVPLWGNPREDRDWDKSPPPYTSSIDAALTLVPEGFHIQLADWTEPTLIARGAWHAILSRGIRGTLPSLQGSLETRCMNAPSPAIAICIAALKAIEEQP